MYFGLLNDKMPISSPQMPRDYDIMSAKHKGKCYVYRSTQ